MTLGLGRESVVHDRRRRALRDATRRPGGGDRRGPSRRAPADGDRRHDRDDVVDRDRSGRGDRRRSPSARACGCTSTRRTPGRSRSSRSVAAPFEGWERADSIVLNPHKWLFTPLDASLLLTRRMDRPPGRVQPRARVPAHARSRDAGPRLQRVHAAARPAVPRAQAVDPVCAGSASRACAPDRPPHRAWPTAFAGWVDADPDWERLAPVPFSTVCFRWRPRAVAAEDAAASSTTQRRGSWTRSTGPARSSCRTPGSTIGSRSGCRSATCGPSRATSTRAWALLRARPRPSTADGR